MRVRTLLAALALTASSLAILPIPAFADGIDAPPVVHHRVARPQRRPAPVVAPVPVAPPSNNVVLPIAFFGPADGGVGIDVGTGYVGGGSTTIVNGGNSISISSSTSSASASASAHSNSNSSSNSGGGHGGYGGGGHGGGHGGHNGGGGHPGGGGGGCGCQ